MNIVNEQQLDFSDVLIQPKRSNLNSRKEVDLYRAFKKQDVYEHLFEESPFKCIPVCVSNMGTVGTTRVARHIVKYGMMCALEKHIDNEDIIDLYDNIIADWNGQGQCPFQNIAISIGVNEPLDSLIELNSTLHNLQYNRFVNGINIINIDVANGYQTRLIDRVKEVRDKFPNAWIIAGNVVTPDIVYDLIHNGANIAKIGIGNGCFLAGNKVITKDGLKNIEDVKKGDYVLTHNNQYKKVINTFKHDNHKEIISINGIKCTPDHKFYVCDKKDVDKINDSNYKQYCFWIEAKKLDKNIHKLIRIK